MLRLTEGTTSSCHYQGCTSIFTKTASDGGTVDNLVFEGEQTQDTWTMVAMSGDEKMDNYDETLLGARGAASFRSPTRRRACVGADIPVLAFVANKQAGDSWCVSGVKKSQSKTRHIDLMSAPTASGHKTMTALSQGYVFSKEEKKTSIPIFLNAIL